MRKPLTGGGLGNYAFVITFDDGSDGTYDEAFSYMNTYGLNGTSYVIGNSIGGAGSMTWAEALEMHNAGWDIANHSDTHTNFTTLTEAEIETELTDCHAAIEANVGTRASKHVAYPFGGQDADVDAAMEDTGMTTGRNTVVGYFDYLSPPDYRYLTTKFGSEAIPLNTMKSWIDDAVRFDKSLILSFHEVVDAGEAPNITPEKFQALIDWIMEKGYTLSTISELATLAGY